MEGLSAARRDADEGAGEKDVEAVGALVARRGGGEGGRDLVEALLDAWRGDGGAVVGVGRAGAAAEMIY